MLNMVHRAVYDTFLNKKNINSSRLLKFDEKFEIELKEFLFILLLRFDIKPKGEQHNLRL